MTYKTIAFLDSNTIFHCHDLRELPWSEIDDVGPILLFAVESMVNEIDGKKKDGRLSKRAREFLRLITPLTESDDPVSIAESPVKVDLVFRPAGPIDWASLDNLDRTEGDDRILAEILHAPSFGAQNRLVVSHDRVFLIKARGIGLQPKVVPDEWLSKPEASPQDKKIAQLQREIKELKKDEPDFLVSCSLKAGVSAVVNSVAPPDVATESAICEYIRAQNPKEEQTTSSSSIFAAIGSSEYDPSYPQRYAKYVEEDIPQFAAVYHRYLELHYAQKPFKIRIENTGRLIAKDMAVDISIANGWVLERPILVPLLHGPNAPRPKRFHDRLLGAGGFLGSINLNPVASHEFDTDEINHSTQFTTRCRDFRQGKSWDFDGVLYLDPDSKEDCKVIIRITASNLKDVVVHVSRFPKAISSVAIDELVDLNEGLLRTKSSLDELDLDPFQMDLDYEIDLPISPRS